MSWQPRRTGGQARTADAVGLPALKFAAATQTRPHKKMADRQGAADIRPIFQKSFALLRERSWQCAEWNFVRCRYLAHLSWARSALQAEPNHRNRLGACCPDSASYACRTENDWRLSE